MKFTLLLPAFNEEKRLPDTLDRLSAFTWPQHLEPEILIVCDGCRDRTAEVARSYAGRLPGLRVMELAENRGKGAAVTAGMMAATGEWIAFTDADESYPFAHHLPLLFQQTEGNAQVVIGHRKHPASATDEIHPPLLRQLMSRVYATLTRLLLNVGVPDAQAGLKMFHRTAARQLFPHVTVHGFGFDTEVLFLARRLGFTVHDVPVQVRHVAESRVRPLRDSVAMITNLFTIRWRHRRTAAGAAPMSPAVRAVPAPANKTNPS